MELMARPPEEMVSVPADWICVPETVPNTVSEPPLLTVVALAVPPDWTVSVSPLLIVSPSLVCRKPSPRAALLRAWDGLRDSAYGCAYGQSGIAA